MDALGSAVNAGGAALGAPPAAAPDTPIDFTGGIDTSDLAALQRRKIATDQATAGEQERLLRADRSRAQNFLDREGVGPDDLQKWDAEAEKRKYETNPIESFGSLASVFAIAAAAFTKAPMENALNGAASAMNAIRERDDEGYKRAFEAWKANTDLAIKRHNMMHQDYQDAISLMTTDLTLGEAKLKASAARFGDQKTLFYMEHGMFPELFQMVQARNAAAEGMLKVQRESDEYTIRRHVFEADPRRFSQDPQEQMRAFKDAMGIKPNSVEDEWQMKYWAAHPATGDKKADLDAFVTELAKFRTAQYGNRGGSADKQTIDLKAAELMDQATARGETLSLADARLQAQTMVARAKQQAQIIPPEQLDQLGWNKATIDAAARTYNKSGVMPRNLGTRTVAAAITGAIQNRANELMQAEGITAEQRAKNWQKFKAQQIAIQRFESGPQGNTIRSLGVVVDHLGTLRQLALLLHNGNIPAFNKMAQEWAEQTGSKIPTNFDEARQIVGTEIIKALGVAGAGTQAERAEAAAAFSRWRSPQQLLGGIDDVMRPLMLGQLKGLERQFVRSTGLTHEEFLNLLGPEAEKFMRPPDKKGEAKPAPTQADIDYAKAHPDVHDRFVAKFGREP